MNLIKYRAFIKVAELGSITKAAKDLGYSQPGVSHMIDSLEEEVGFSLLNRGKDSLKPTENGKRILNYCYQMVKSKDAMDEMISAINGILIGTLNIGSFNSMLVDFLPKVVSVFSKTYSGIELHLREKSISEAHESLLNGTLDICFMSNELPKGFEFIPLFKDPVCLLMPKDHPLAAYDVLTPSHISGCEFIMPVVGWDDVANIILKCPDSHPNIKHYVASDTAGVSMVSNGMGIYVISKLLTRLLPDNVIAKEFHGDYYREMGIALKSKKQMTLAMKEFVKTAQKVGEEFEIK